MKDWLEYISTSVAAVTAFSTWLGGPPTPADYVHLYEADRDASQTKFCVVGPLDDPIVRYNRDQTGSGRAAYAEEDTSSIMFYEITDTAPTAAEKQAFLQSIQDILLGILGTAPGSYRIDDLIHRPDAFVDSRGRPTMTIQFDDGELGLAAAFTVRFEGT